MLGTCILPTICGKGREALPWSNRKSPENA
jgi:hypothetical protein